jgi:hypothetical protein
MSGAPRLRSTEAQKQVTLTLGYGHRMAYLRNRLTVTKRTDSGTRMSQCKEATT